MDKQTLRRADLFFSYVLMLISTWFFIMSVKVFFSPFGRELSSVNAEEIKISIIEWYKSPALFPFILSVIIFICAIMLMHIARKDGARLDFFTKEKITAFIKSREVKVVLTVTAIVALYIFIIIPLCRKNLNFFPAFQGFPFMISTFVFLSIFIITFNEKTVKKIIISLIVAAVSAVAITYGFGNMALIPLP